MSKKLSSGGKPANPYPKRFYVPADVKALGNYGRFITKAMRSAYDKRMQVDCFKIRGKKK